MASPPVPPGSSLSLSPTGGDAGDGAAYAHAHRLELEEGERQMVLLALAHLSRERPGWDDALNRIALRIDNEENGRAKLYDAFRKLDRRLIHE